MSNAIIAAAMESRLKAWAAAKVPPIQVAYENSKFTPPAERYVSAYLLPAKTASDTLDSVHRSYSGVFQVSITVPSATFAGAARALAAELDALYPVSFEHSGLRITITSPMSAAGGIPDASGYTIPVSCSYRADTM